MPGNGERPAGMEAALVHTAGKGGVRGPRARWIRWTVGAGVGAAGAAATPAAALMRFPTE